MLFGPELERDHKLYEELDAALARAAEYRAKWRKQEYMRAWRKAKKAKEAAKQEQRQKHAEYVRQWRLGSVHLLLLGTCLTSKV